MTLYRIASLVVLIGLLQVLVSAQESLTPWRSDPLFQRFAAALDAVPAIDVHTHLLYGTDASAYPSVPGGADVHHLMLTRATRDALYLALSGLVRDGVIDEQRALEIGRGILRENARRLHGWK
jgi:hypothetical protein